MQRVSRGSFRWPMALCAVWGLAACAQAPPPAADPVKVDRGHLTVEDAWSLPALAGANGAVYLTLVNTAGAPARLLGARCADAAATELHQVVSAGDVMRMSPVEDGLEVPAGGRLELAPAGHHLMVIDLARDLAAGDHLALVLELEHDVELEVSVPVFTDPRTDE